MVVTQPCYRRTYGFIFPGRRSAPKLLFLAELHPEMRTPLNGDTFGSSQGCPYFTGFTELAEEWIMEKTFSLYNMYTTKQVCQ
jgi:hypothetical protein